MLAILLPCLLVMIRGVDGTATVTLELVRFASIGTPRKADGTPCDSSAFQACDPFFQICFDPNGGTDCNRVLTPIYRDAIATTFDDLQSLEFRVDTLTTYNLEVNLLDSDAASNFARASSQPMGVVTSQANLQVGAWPVSTRTSNQLHDVDFRITVRCDDGFFGADCSTNCVPRNDPSNGHFTCNGDGTPVCRPGFENPSTTPPCTSTVDPCTGNPCGNGGACSDAGSGNFACDCTGTGFTGDTCTDNINECDVFRPCVNGGVCADGAMPNTFTCACPSGFTGTRCETLVDICATADPCQNGATCHLGNPGQVLCACPPGYDGDFCQNDVNECSLDPCENGGTCTQLSPPNFSCTCATGFNGPLCEGLDSPCLNNPCRNGATCTSAGPGNFNCACTPGYSGVTCEVDEDACAANPCQNGGRCTDTLGGFVCCCRTGYAGDTCQDFRQEIDLNRLVIRRFFFLGRHVIVRIVSRCPGVEFIPNSLTVVVDSLAERNCVFTSISFSVGATRAQRKPDQ